MTTVVSVAQGGTGANSALLARTALGVPPSAAYDQANTARDQANTARTQANTGYDQANSAYGQANSAYGQANTAYGQANTAYGQANSAYAQANSAFSDANTRLSASGGTLAGDLIITGNLTVSGNSTTLNAEILTIEDADVVLLSNVASTPALNAGIIVNRGTSTNTFLRWDEVTDKWGWSDDGSTTYKFNSALDAYAQANSAYGAANNAVLKAGDTMTGQLNVSSGGLLVTGNVGIGTSSPTSKLHVHGTSNRKVEIDFDNTRVIANGLMSIAYGDNALIKSLLLENLSTGAVVDHGSAIQWRLATNAAATAISAGQIAVAKELTWTSTASTQNSYMSFGTTNSGVFNERVRINSNGNFGIGTTSPAYKLEVNGSFAATTKSFVINHPTKPGMKLRYGSLEGPENGVYVRGKLTGNVIELPDYWTGLVDLDSITVNLTPIGKYQKLFIEKIEDDKVYVASENWFGQINCFYIVFAERKDVEKLVVEY